MFDSLKRKHPLFEIAMLGLLTGLVFLPFAFRLTYHRDDWYYMLDGLYNGPLVFHRMFEIDRPLRGYFFRIYFSLFGMYPPAYHVGMYLWRMAAAGFALWFFRILWPGRRLAAFSAALLLALYPGYSWWVAGVEHQPMMASLALQALSMALTLQAVREQGRISKAALFAASIVTGWLYIGLVDYAIGMEVMRLLAVFILIRREAPGRGARAWAVEVLRRAGITLAIPAGFLLWRQFFFENQRGATDVSAQLGRLLQAPVSTGITWAIHLLQSALNVGLFAWTGPFFRDAFSGGLTSLLYAILGSLLVAGLALLALRRLARSEPGDPAAPEDSFAAEAIRLGIAGILFGVLPVIAANRSVTYPGYSHYGLPASMAAVILAAGLLALLGTARARLAATAVLIGMACMAHLGLAQNELAEQGSIARFWQQMAWRAPGLADGTTLAVKYADLEYGDDRAVVWGPANLIYDPGRDAARTPDGSILYRISAAFLDTPTLNEIAAQRSKYQVSRRGHVLEIQYSRLLVVSQPAARACVHVIDPRWPELSTADTPTIRWLASYSHFGQVIQAEASPAPQEMLFGAEPLHDWCYYYEKAELARESGDWPEIVGLYASAAGLGLGPSDLIELMPFLQAFAALNNPDALRVTAGQLNVEPYYRLQACRNLGAMPAAGYPLPGDMLALIDEIFCGGGP